MDFIQGLKYVFIQQEMTKFEQHYKIFLFLCEIMDLMKKNY